MRNYKNPLPQVLNFLLSIPNRFDNKTRKNIRKFFYGFFQFIADISRAFYHFSNSIVRLLSR